MKPKSTNRTLIIAVAILLASFKSNSQNLLNNSDFLSGTTAWVLNGMNVEINNETVYGGYSNNNPVAEIDAQVGLRQKMSVTAGKLYTIAFKASRRTSGTTPATVGILVRIIGTSGTTYVNYTREYSNTVFGYTNESKTFSIPASSGENVVVVEFTAYNNSTSHGVIVDDIEMTSASASSLPVQWISFTGELKNQQAVLNWKTASELNNKYYVVERSVNGNRYDSIGVVKASANGNNSNSYSFTDASVKPGTNFYRLRQVDVDDAAKFSKVVSVRLSNGADAIKVFPTVANSNINFNVSNASAGNATVSVYDAAGKMILSSQKTLSNGANQQSIDVSNLTKGAYYFNIRNNDGSINHTQAFHKVD